MLIHRLSIIFLGAGLLLVSEPERGILRVQSVLSAAQMAFKAGQRKLRQNIHADGTLDKGFVKKFDSYRGIFGIFNLGGLALGLFLSLIGVLIAYLITTGDKKGR